MRTEDRLGKRLLGLVAVQDRANNVVSVDLASFATTLLLFDTFVLYSVWLTDLLLLAAPFGISGLVALFEAGALQVVCESYSVAEIGRARANLKLTGNIKPLPLGCYSFAPIRVQDQEKKIEQNLEAFDSVLDSPQHERERLKQLISTNLLKMPQDFSSQVFSGFYSDLRSNPELLRTALSVQLRTQGINPRKLDVALEEIEPEDFRVKTNLEKEYGVSETFAHNLVSLALMGIGTVNQKLVQMMTYSALTGMREPEAPLLVGKLRLLRDLSHALDDRERFARVVRIAGLPTPRLGTTKVDAEKLLRVRESDECRAFRDWLSGTDSLSDKEIRSRIKGLRSKFASFVSSTTGKTLRFLVSNGVAAISGGPIAGWATSMLDSFVLERFAKRDAIFSFLDDSYPSVFRNG